MQAAPRITGRYPFGATKIKGTYKGTQQDGDGLQNAALAMAIPRNQHRQIVLERQLEVFEATEVLDVKLFDQHDLASGEW